MDIRFPDSKEDLAAVAKLVAVWGDEGGQDEAVGRLKKVMQPAELMEVGRDLRDEVLTEHAFSKLLCGCVLKRRDQGILGVRTCFHVALAIEGENRRERPSPLKP